MRKLFAIGAALTLAFAVSSAASASFAVGSAKTELDVVVGNEHASFSAHNTGGSACEAKGQIVYTNEVVKFTADIDELRVVGTGAFFGGPVTKTSDPFLVGKSVFFNATDSGLPGGRGDTFFWEVGFITTEPPGVIHCATVLVGHPITSGNIVIKGGA